MLVRAFASVVCAAAMSAPTVAHGGVEPDASRLTVTLDYEAPPECPNVDDFKITVVERLGYDAFDGDATKHVLVQLMPRGRGFEGHIEWHETDGKWVGDRVFPSRSEDCRDLHRAMAFALALQIQLSAFARITPASPQDEVKPPPPLPVTPIPPAEPAVRRVPATLAVGAGVSEGFGLSSAAVPIARLFGILAWTRLSVEVAAEAGWPTETRRNDGAGFSQRHLLLSVAGCGRFGSWSSCVLAKAGEVLVAPKDVDVPSSPSGPIAETGLRLAFTQTLGRHAFVAAHADGLVNLIVWTVTLDNVPVWTSPRFAATVGLDAGVRFP